MMKKARRLLFGISLLASLAVGAMWLAHAGSVPVLLPLALLAVSAGTAIVTGVSEARSWQLPDPEDPPMLRRPIMPKSPAEKAVEAMNNAQDMSSRTQRKVRIRIDTDDQNADTL